MDGWNPLLSFLEPKHPTAQSPHEGIGQCFWGVIPLYHDLDDKVELSQLCISHHCFLR